MAGPFFAMMFITFTAGYVLEGRRLWLGAAIATLLAAFSAAVDQNSDPWGDVAFAIAIGIAGPMLFGQLLRNRTRLNRALREKARRIEGGRAREAEAAALEERTRIAGELHDVVAHALSAMTVQAAAARRLAERDPDRAREAFAGAESDGPRGADRAAPAARRPAQGGRGARARAAAEPRPRRGRSCAVRRAAGCRPHCIRRAGSARCPPAST